MNGRAKVTDAQVPSESGEGRGTAYNDARREISALARDTDGIVAVYEYGTRRAPGVSDIDVIAVGSPGIQPDELCSWMADDRLSDSLLGMLDGGAVKLATVDQFACLNWLGEVRPRSIWGSSRLPRLLSPTNRRLVRIADIMDWLPERVATLVDYSRMPEPPLTRAVNCAYSMRHTIERIVSETDWDPAESSPFLEYLDQIRSGWFSRGVGANRELVAGLLPNAINLGQRMLTYVSSYLIRTGLYTPPRLQQSVILHLNPRVAFVFTPGDAAAKEMDDVQRGPVTLEVPVVWLTHATAYAACGGWIGGMFRSNLTSSTTEVQGEVDRKLASVINRRAKLVNEMADLLVPLGLQRSMYRFGHLKDTIDRFADSKRR